MLLSNEINLQQAYEDQENYMNLNENNREARTSKLSQQIDRHQLMDLKIGYAFKQLFGKEHHKDMITAFLNAIFDKTEIAPIQYLSFKNIEIAGEYEDGKEACLDMLVETEDKESINVKIQFTNQREPKKQSLSYWSQLYQKQFEGNKDDNEFNPVVTINILNFDLIEDDDKFHRIFRLFENEKNFWLTNMLECHLIEIPKLIRAWKQEALNPWEDHLARWLLLFGIVDEWENYFYDDIYQELEKITSIDKTLEKAIEGWGNLSSSKEARLIYEARLKQIFDQQSLLQDIELAMQKCEVLERKYEQQKIKTAEQKKKWLEAEEKSVTARREAAKIIIRYGKIVARNLLEQGMDSAFVRNAT
ncbi:Rpn family recombination-promoting nuclease/putative transposase [Oceanobacillus sp. J11TS1]|uniref:Rpn family recombination-promoting nuclease/putative transposase n=1 Tax=Oceanobacillus sp. J11TS1 TaxID=2807191 RepID=UPI001B1E4388|nr:Rpn family recombination-promoting nuclease/putative transposase [Oceanobacillus sp. J11TS1]GIO23733.1 hypothetical protein J11TS1_23140 [Oceanobacillus sp. J11TS1]